MGMTLAVEVHVQVKYQLVHTLSMTPYSAFKHLACCNERTHYPHTRLGESTHQMDCNHNHKFLEVEDARWHGL